MNSVVQQNMALIREIFIQHGVKNSYLFGSATNKDFNENSDIDFIFNFSENIDYETYANNYFSLIEKLENLLGRKVDLVAEKTLKNPYLIQQINLQKIQIV